MTSSNDSLAFQIEYYAGAVNEPLEAFREKFGLAFFIHDGEIGAAGALERTTLFRTIFPIDAAESSPKRLKIPAEKQWVFPVRSSGRATFSHFISVGRSNDYDIVLNHSSVSKFHASITLENGIFMLQDGGSRNGTFINNERLVTRVKMEMKTGAKVRFGDVTLQFMKCTAFRDHLRRIYGD